MQLAVNEAADPAVRATALAAVNEIYAWAATDEPYQARARARIDAMRNDPASVGNIVPVTVPPGSPIGGRGE